ncbi:hypothetical protein NX862_14520 [Rhodobacter sp. KR11]|uniref:hypothetical protein n=1 Tax=Rhodobacter sp. KR11 TaxID=2974588 RepID=UPI00222371E5|nr:hypothetical protein [Rhodobacter sp. KR11]MCW1919972.1 hypothetical protein [Rhodobacter sp. KR11]
MNVAQALASFTRPESTCQPTESDFFSSVPVYRHDGRGCDFFRHNLPRLGHASKPVVPLVVSGASDDLTWYFDMLALGSDAPEATVVQTKAVLSGVLELVAKGNFRTLSRILAEEKTLTVNTTALVAMARAAHSYCDRIVSWAAFVGKLVNIVEDRGMNAKRVLRGLV